MNLFLRLFLVWFFQSRGRKASVLDTVVTRTRILPNDLDLNLHVNNGRVLSLADIGRIDWFTRTGCMRAAMQNGWMPVIGDATARYIKQLKAFEPITLESRMLGWGEKWAFMEHRLLRQDGQLAAIVVIRGMFWGKKSGSVPPARLLEATGQPPLPSPALPDWVQSWAAALDQLSAASKKA